jgi:hypothetical protein
LTIGKAWRSEAGRSWETSVFPHLTWRWRPIMHDKSEPTRWDWKEGKVDRSAPHLKLFCGDLSESASPVALVAKPFGQSFAVEFLQIPELDQGEYERIKRAVTKELTFYLVEMGGSDPWNYAIHHCGTASNLYSDVHWGYFPGGAE